MLSCCLRNCGSRYSNAVGIGSVRHMSLENKYAMPDNGTMSSNKRASIGGMNENRDVIIIGGGHNGLTAAAYLAKAGLDVAVLERRHVAGGAAITEEIYKPGYKFSRASYLAGLLRPSIIKELQLSTKYGLSFFARNPTSFTPTRMNDPMYGGKHLMFWSEEDRTYDSIAQFSQRDADLFPQYEEFLSAFRDFLQPLLDHSPPNMPEKGSNLYNEWKLHRQPYADILGRTIKCRNELMSFYQFLTAPADTILNRWFDSQILKATLATDAVIGSVLAPSEAGSAYVLLHHVMGEVEGRKGVWAYCKGGMGSITDALSAAASDFGAEIICNASVSELLTTSDYDGKTGQYSHNIDGVKLTDGTILRSKIVLSNATPYHTFVELLANQKVLPPDFIRSIDNTDYTCGAMKINCVVDQLPNFECLPNVKDSFGNFIVGPQHFGTIHFESQLNELEMASKQAKSGIPAERPIIEMTIPSSLDPTLVPSPVLGKHHIVQLFIQYAPYDLNFDILGVQSWDESDFKQRFADRVFGIIDEFAPNFSKSVMYRDILSPRDLERIFGLHKGNIFHGALSLHQLGYFRPAPGWSSYRSPIGGLYMCGSGTHPGGGVMGAPGRNCARHVLAHMAKL